MELDKWIETTLRKGTKTPKICRDMFITDSRGKFAFCIVKNGSTDFRESLSVNRAKEIIKEKNLVSIPSLLDNCYTYRTQKSTDLVYRILNAF